MPAARQARIDTPPLIAVRNLVKTYKTPAGDFTAIKNLDVMERTREMGFLRSLGAQNSAVRRIVIGEGVLIGVLSWGMSLPLSIPLAIWLGDALGGSLLARPLDHQFSFVAAAIWLVLVIVIAIVASLLPAQNAARLTIRDALVYE